MPSERKIVVSDENHNITDYVIRHKNEYKRPTIIKQRNKYWSIGYAVRDSTEKTYYHIYNNIKKNYISLHSRNARLNESYKET